MSAVARRVEGLVNRHGESFTVGGAPRRGLFSPISSGFVRSFLAQAELDGVAPPFWVCLVAATDATAVGDVVEWNGTSSTVRRVVPARFRGSTVARLLVFGLA